MRTVRAVARFVFCVAIVVIIAVAGYNIYLKASHPTEFNGFVEYYCDEYNVDIALVMAVIKCESGYNKDAQSDAGAKGLMQLTEETFYDVHKMVDDSEEITYETHWNDTETNIKYGTKYISYLFRLFDGDKTAVLAAYNAGMGNVRQWMGDDNLLTISEIRFPETKDYVEKVLKAEETYKKLYP